MDVPDSFAERSHESLRRFAGENRMAGVDAGGDPGVRGKHPVHVMRSRKGLVPMVLHADRDARRQALDDGLEHLRGDAGDDCRCRKRLGELESLQAALESVLGAEEEATRLGDVALRRAKADYSPAAAAQGLRREWERLVDKRLGSTSNDSSSS